MTITACPVSKPEAEGGTKASLTSDPGRPGTYTREDGSIALWFRRETGASVLPRTLSTKHFTRMASFNPLAMWSHNVLASTLQRSKQGEVRSFAPGD